MILVTLVFFVLLTFTAFHPFPPTAILPSRPILTLSIHDALPPAHH